MRLWKDPAKHPLLWSNNAKREEQPKSLGLRNFIACSLIPKYTFPASSNTRKASSITFTNEELPERAKLVTAVSV